MLKKVVKIGEYVKTKNVYMEDIEGPIVKILTNTFIVEVSEKDYHLVPIRNYKKGFPDPNKKLTDVEYFVPCKKLARHI